MLYLVSDFTPARMLDRRRVYSMSAVPITLATVKRLLTEENTVVLAVGQEATAKVLSQVLQVAIPQNPMPIVVEDGDKLIIAELEEDGEEPRLTFWRMVFFRNFIQER